MKKLRIGKHDKSFGEEIIIQGVYQIRNHFNSHVYIGQSQDVLERLVNHRRDLRKDKHQNKLMQEEFNKYGMRAFCFEILEIENDLVKRLNAEQEWMIAIHTDRGFLYNGLQVLSYELSQRRGKRQLITPFFHQVLDSLNLELTVQEKKAL